MKNGQRLTKYLICVFVTGLVSYLSSRVWGFEIGKPPVDNMRALSDGCFTGGFLTAGMGALMLISTTGFFDMFGYAFKSLGVLFTSLKSPSRHVKYYDYKTEKAEKRGKPTYFMLVIGLAFIALSLVFLYLYYNI